MEKRSLSCTSLVDSVDEEFVASSSEVRFLPDESFGEDSTIVHDEKIPKTEGCDKDDDKHNLEADLDSSISFLNETSESWRMDRSRNKKSSFKEDERYDEKRESVSMLSANNIISDRIGTRTQERRTWDNVHIDENSHVASMRAHCENAEELRPDKAQDEIVQDCQSDSYDFYDAVRSGNVKRVFALIASGCVQNLDEPDWNVSADPPLLVAATNQCLPVLK